MLSCARDRRRVVLLLRRGPWLVQGSDLEPSEGGKVSDTKRGLYQKYEVKRVNDPTGKHAGCWYFVLDPKHDKFAPIALRAYADACVGEYPALAADLRKAAPAAQPAEV